MTGYLQVAIGLAKPYTVVVPVLEALIRKSGESRVLDLASGGGGPWPGLVNELKTRLGKYVTVTLTDIQPNLTAATELDRLPGVSYRREPVSALAIPVNLHGVRTLFTGLHHFNAAEVQSIFRAAQEARVPFLAAEATHRSLKGILVMLFVPLMVFLLMPWVRPRRILPLLLTYLLPIIPLLIWWDGFASTMKSYRPGELKTLMSEIQKPEYLWNVEEVKVRGSPIPVMVVVGCPMVIGFQKDPLNHTS
jgi:hypothetical protein